MININIKKVIQDNSNQRVVFVNEASSSIGMGHILRSMELARIMSSRGYNVTGITIGDQKAVSFVQERAKDELFNWSQQTVQNSQSAIDCIKNVSPSVIVVDCSESSLNIVEACMASGIVVVALDYFLTQQPLPAVIINLIDHNSSSLSGQPPPRNGVAYFEGPQYAIIRNEFLESRVNRINREERSLIKNILIAFGGADPSGNTRRALEELAKWPSKFSIDVIVGPLFTLDIESLITKLKFKCKIKTHKSPKNMGKLFENADLVLCGGGGTLLEALCVGIPSIVIAQNEAELRHAKALADCDACWVFNQANWEHVKVSDKRKQMSKIAQTCIDGRGAERICDVIEQQIN